jgi:hypothetical protein
VVKAKKPETVHDRRAEIPAIQVAGTVVAVVRDPYPDPYTGMHHNITVIRSTKDDPLAGMLARRQIDLAQHEAGREWQRYWEDAAIGSVRAVDPTKEPVDGKGPSPTPFSDLQRKAMLELRHVAIVLGWEGDRLVRDILGDRVQLADAAMRRSRSKKYIGIRFRECLETMAHMWHFA